MSRRVATDVTVTIDDVEQDVSVRAHVEVSSRGFASIDGEPQVWIDEAWKPIDSVNISDADREHIEESICDEAFRDDGDDGFGSEELAHIFREAWS